MEHESERDLYSLFHEINIRIGRGPRQGLSVRPGQNKVLKILDKHGTMRQQDILQRLGIRAGSLSELMRKLEKDEHIERHRNETNKSEIIVTITEKGRISALEHEMSLKERDEELFGCLDPDEKQALIATLNKVIDAWQEEEPESAEKLREKRWQEVAQMQNEQREIEALLDHVTSEQRQR